MRERPKMPPISEEMKQWSAMLKTEVTGWPQLSTKPMFGMMGLYRGKKIFGGLPVTRGFDTPNSVIFRFGRARIEGQTHLPGETLVFVRCALHGRFARRPLVAEPGVRENEMNTIAKAPVSNHESAVTFSIRLKPRCASLR